MVVVILLVAGTTWAQAPAAAQANVPTRVAVIDFNRAVTENSDGKKAFTSISAEISKKQGEFTKVQGEIDTIQKDLQTKDAALSAQAKADMTKQIDTKQTALTRMNEDAPKEIQDLQNTLLGPVAQRTQKVLDVYAEELGFAVVFDYSSQTTPVIHYSEVADITTEVIRRVDADIAKNPAGAATPAKPAAAPAAPKQ